MFNLIVLHVFLYLAYLNYGYRQNKTLMDFLKIGFQFLF